MTSLFTTGVSGRFVLGNCEVDKTDDYDKLEVSIETLMPKQLCRTRGISGSSSESIDVKFNNTRADETSVRSLKKWSRKSCINATEEKGKSEQNVKELTSCQKLLKLCNIKNQSENSDQFGVISFAYTTIKPINYKHMQELSFRDLILTSASYSSEDNSPFLKYSDGDSKSSSTMYPCVSARWHASSCDRIIDRIEEEPLLLHSTVCGSGSNANSTEYDPNLIANFDYRARKTVMKFNGYVSTVTHYQPDSEVKRLVNEAFRSCFPHVYVSFSKIKSIKRELHQIAVACNLEDTTTAHAYVFYEKVLLKGLVCKMNRKLVVGAALLIAAKITDFGSTCISDVVNYLESSLRISRKELLRYEIPLCAALSFNLRVPVWQ
ncbi:cyclin domain-containing protein [Wuchereria bancrofti]|uniref:Cyclin domain-containing protein n=1 Tax=Wuchereria bancrofti TaxID=6293 RepID=J9ETB2_WUCBA|nr:cyclin domain-containing protein [Wuchereria bancrofti]